MAKRATKKRAAPSNEEAVRLLGEIARLFYIKGENVFKTKAFENAQYVIDGRDDLYEKAQAGTLTEIEGIGKGISEVLTEFMLEGHSSILDDIRDSIPKGLLDLIKIPGLGPKKAMRLIDEMKIRTVPDLEKACKAGKLIKLKGFGEKFQDRMIREIEILNS